MRTCHPGAAKSTVRTFECPDCKARMYATKRNGKTNAGHIKDMWCYRCKEVKKFIQI